MSKMKRMLTMALASFMVMGLLVGAGIPSTYASKKCPSCGSTSVTTSMDTSGHYTYHCNRCGYSFI